MDDRQEVLAKHFVILPPTYLPDPSRHLGNIRDSNHYVRALRWLQAIGARTVLDVGCYDGWLDFLLIENGFGVTGVELLKELAEAAVRYRDRNFINYEVHVGYFLDLAINKKFDAVICFETLEHMPLDDARESARRFSSLANKGVIISLPNQDYRQNAQHLWTPSENIIREIWGNKPGYTLEYVSYPDTTIPANWFVSHLT